MNNIQTQIILAEQLTNALKEVGRLEEELQTTKNANDFYFKKMQAIEAYCEKNDIKIPSDISLNIGF